MRRFLSLFFVVLLFSTSSFAYRNEIKFLLYFSGVKVGDDPSLSRDLSSDGYFEFYCFSQDTHEIDFSIYCRTAVQKEKAVRDLQEIADTLIKAGHADYLIKNFETKKYLFISKISDDDFSNIVRVYLAFDMSKNFNLRMHSLYGLTK